MATLLEGKFLDFHQSHPEIYQSLVANAKMWRRRRGPSAKLGAKMLIEHVRWSLGIKSTIDVPQINNNHTAFYARLIMDNEEELEGIFNLRRQQEQAGFGPDASQVPENEHVI